MKLCYIKLKLASGVQFLNIELSVQFFFFYKTVYSAVHMKIIQDFIALLEEDEWYAWYQQDGTILISYGRKKWSL